MEVYPQLNRIVDLIKTGKCKKIAFLTGAGISVGAGKANLREFCFS
jgi:NAD-dependent SIR2 family protein deacetylase